MTGGAMRIALLNPCFWPEVRRGAERFARDLADGLLAQGDAVRLLTSHRGRPSRTVEDGLEILRSWRPPDHRLTQRRRYEDHLTHLPASYLALRLGSDDVAHALYATDAAAAVRWSARSGRPTVFTYMGLPVRSYLVARRRRAELTARVARDADAVVALSETAAAAFDHELGVRPRVIAPGVDPDAWAPAAARAEGPTIFCAAALDRPRKRVGLLVDAFARLRRDRPDVRLVLSRPRDRAAAARVAQVDGVELRDVDDHAALRAAYGEAWVSVLPSVGEAFGLVLVESLACGTPVVGSDDGAIPEVIDRPEIGGTFAGEDPAALARVLAESFELAGDPATAAACRARALDFSLGRTVDAYRTLYREVIDARG